MNDHQTTEARLAKLEQKLRRAQWTAAGAVAAAALTVTLGFARQPADNDVQELVRARRIELVDDKGVVRVRMHQDAADGQRRSRAAGINVYDAKGDERGGLSTMDDGSVVFAMDAPRDVGSPMRDRLGLVVWPNGASYIMLIDNETRGVVKLMSDGKGGGGLQHFKWDMEGKQIHTKTVNFDGEKTDTKPLKN